MLLLGHAAVSARRGPRGTCQETRAALWAPAECGVTARSASDGVDVNGIRVHHRRLQYRKYQCGMHSEGNPSGPFVLGLRELELKGLRCASRLMRSAARASCVLRSVPKSKLMAGPAMSGLRGITAGGIMVRFARLERASCCGMHSEGNPSGPFVLGLRGLGLKGRKARFARFGWGLSRRRVWRFAPRVLSIGIEMHLTLLAL